jgi:hypothetical protein
MIAGMALSLKRPGQCPACFCVRSTVRLFGIAGRGGYRFEFLLGHRGARGANKFKFLAGHRWARGTPGEQAMDGGCLALADVAAVAVRGGNGCVYGFGGVRHVGWFLLMRGGCLDDKRIALVPGTVQSMFSASLIRVNGECQRTQTAITAGPPAGRGTVFELIAVSGGNYAHCGNVIAIGLEHPQGRLWTQCCAGCN